ncbi:MAG: FeoA family protein [Saprospiraceae bacterium]|jgi:ferrous iron transport protein A|nr:FeoA family protein [Saprospiraceae bacterium]
MKLSDLKIGQKSIVQNFTNTQMGGKLMTMGMLPGSLVELVRKASAGKTFFIKVNGFGMAVRKNEAANILLEEVAN